MPHDLALPNITDQVPYDVEQAIDRLRAYSVALDGAREDTDARLRTLTERTATFAGQLAQVSGGAASLLVSILETTRLIVGTITLEGFTPGAVLFVGAGSILSEDPTTFFWDAATNRLGLNTIVPASRLDVQGTVTINGATVTLTQDTNFVLGGGVNGVSFDGTTLSVDGTNNRVGFGTAAPDTTVALAAAGVFGWLARSRLLSPSDGVVTLSNAAENAFTRLNFGGTSSSFPALTRSSAALQVRVADDSAFARIAALGFDMSVQQTYTVTNPSTDRAFDVTAPPSNTELAAVLGTVIADLQTVGLFQ